ncbi:MAG: hypothetical protein V4510_05605 [bacterium]
MAHAFKERGSRGDGSFEAIDISRLAQMVDNKDGVLVAFPIIRAESRAVVQREAPTRLAGHGYDKLNRLVRKVQADLEVALKLAKEEDPVVTPADEQDAEDYFRLVGKKLPDAGGKPKSSMPDPGDRIIMIQAGKLVGNGREVYVYSKDGHFVHYAKEIQDKWGFEVRNVVDLPGELLRAGF